MLNYLIFIIKLWIFLCMRENINKFIKFVPKNKLLVVQRIILIVYIALQKSGDIHEST